MNPVDLQIDHKEDDISYRFWYHQFSWLNNHQYNHCLNPLNPKLDPYPVAVAWPLLPSSCGLRPLPVPAAAFAALPPGTISDGMMGFRVFFGEFLLNTLQRRKELSFQSTFSGYLENFVSGRHFQSNTSQASSADLASANFASVWFSCLSCRKSGRWFRASQPGNSAVIKHSNGKYTLFG